MNPIERKLASGTRVVSWKPHNSAAPFVLLHGFTGRAESWGELAPRLPTAAHAFDLFGHGREVPESSWEANIDRLHNDIQQLHPRANLVGYSMGGRLALGLLARWPKSVASVTVIGAHVGLATAAERRERKAQDAVWIELLKDKGMRTFLKNWAAQPLFASQKRAPKSGRQLQKELRRTHKAPDLAAALEVLGLAAMPYLMPELARISVPLRLIVGADDKKFCRIAAKIQAARPATTVTKIPDTGHNVLLEAPRELLAALTAPE